MSNPITKLWLWYNKQTLKQRNAFKGHLLIKAGCDESTFYRYLKNEPPKLVKEEISEFTKIPTNELYQTI